MGDDLSDDLDPGLRDSLGERTWKVGDLAGATGLTVRALHHFDAIALLRPAARTAAGHRLYSAGDVRRLYRILALRRLGIPLGEIADMLDGDSGDLGDTVRAQLEQIERRISGQQEARRRLAALSKIIQASQTPSIDRLIEAMEAMMQTKHFTPDQLAQMKERHREAGEDAFGRWHRTWTELAAEVTAHLDGGAGPADPAVQLTARRWAELMEEMTGGDRAILSGMYAKMDGKGPEAATMGVVGTEVWEYMKRVFAVGYGTPL